jgi:hypothetical protein
MLTGELNPRVFIGVYPAAFVYADRERNQGGDYQTIAIIPYSTLEIDWDPRWKPSSADDEAIILSIQQDRDDLQSRIGEQYQVSTCGQYVTLGHAIAA